MFRAEYLPGLSTPLLSIVEFSSSNVHKFRHDCFSFRCGRESNLWCTLPLDDQKLRSVTGFYKFVGCFKMFSDSRNIVR